MCSSLPFVPTFWRECIGATIIPTRLRTEETQDSEKTKKCDACSHHAFHRLILWSEMLSSNLEFDLLPVNSEERPGRVPRAGPTNWYVCIRVDSIAWNPVLSHFVAWKARLVACAYGLKLPAAVYGEGIRDILAQRLWLL